MASPAPLATLGGAKASPSGTLDCCSSPLVVGRIRVVSRISFANCLLARRWPHGVCKCMVRTDLMEKGSLDSTLRGSSNPIRGSSGKDEDADLVLKPAPKPVLNTGPSVLVEPGNSLPWTPAKLVHNDSLEKSVEAREKVIESLGEVLEKAEKLEAASSVKLSTRESRNDGTLKSSLRVGKLENSSPVTRKSKTLKSVWRKGNPVATVEKVFKEVPKVFKEVPKVFKEVPNVNKVREEDSTPTPVAEARKLEAPPQPTLRPQPPSKVAPSLQAKPVVAPTPTPPAVKKPVIRKPILIDKFASKKPVVDHLVEQSVLAPVKPERRHPPSKAKEEHYKKSSLTGSLRRRLVGDDVEEDASGLNVSRTGRKWSKASRKAARRKAAKDAEPVKVEILEVGEEGMPIEDLVYNLATSEAEILNYLFTKGVKPDTVQTLSKDMVKMICKEYEVEVIEADEVKVEQMAKKKEMLDDEDLDMLEGRPPIITIMGHVDHGKTTLLDYIQKSKVVASEAGGITQGIGAYKVEVPVDGKPAPCVFLDTPGHEAFAAMRARGTRVTDIAIIVVAADDGVSPQTIEAIAHAKAAGVPIVVAINKIDKNGANPDRVMQELSSAGLMPEDWGGDVPMVQISALKGKNVDALLETVMLVAELQELKANPHRNAKGTVIEAALEKSTGPTATFIVQNGTLKRGDSVVCGEAFGKVRALFDDRGKRVDKAGPSMAVQVIGLNNVPVAGDEFEVVDSLDVARERADACAESLRAARMSAKAGEGKVTLSSIASGVSAGNLSGLDLHQLNILLKVDVQGSIEAIRQAIQVLPQDNVTLKFLLQAPGDVSTSDVDLAVAAEAVIFGFNVKTPGSVKSYADKQNVEIRLYRVIYDLIDDLRNAMEGLLDPTEEQISVGSAEVRRVFSSGSGRVAGCMVTDGKVSKDCGVRVVRKGKTVYTGTLDSLRRGKAEVKEVGAGLECGIGVNEYMDWEVDDIIEAFNSVKKRRTLEQASATVAAALAGAGVGA